MSLVPNSVRMDDTTILKLALIVVIGAIYGVVIYKGLDPSLTAFAVVIAALVGLVGYTAGAVRATLVARAMHAKGLSP